MGPLSEDVKRVRCRSPKYSVMKSLNLRSHFMKIDLIRSLMKHSPVTFIALSLFVVADIALAQAATEKGVTPIVTAKSSSHFWYDGEQRRELSIDSTTIARFVPGEKAALVAKGLTVKNEKSVTTNDSPVLIDGGLKRGLPGGVIVTLLRAMPDDQAIALLKSAGLEPVKALQDSKVWLVASAPGMASLELANRLHESRQFAASQPNWWTQKTKK